MGVGARRRAVQPSGDRTHQRSRHVGSPATVGLRDSTTSPHPVDFRLNGVDVAEQVDAAVEDARESIRETSVDVQGTAPIAAVSVMKTTLPAMTRWK